MSAGNQDVLEECMEEIDTLLETLQENDVKVYGTPSLSRYNPPWTLPFLRRNEVVVEVARS